MDDKIFKSENTQRSQVPEKTQCDCKCEINAENLLKALEPEKDDVSPLFC